MSKRTDVSTSLECSSPIVRVGRNFQVTIPSEIRKIVPLAEGDYIKTSTSQGQIIFSPVTVVAKRSSANNEEREWNTLVAQNLLDGYDEADSMYDNL